MARTAVSLQTVTRVGLAAVTAAADVANGNYLDNPGRNILILFNNSGGPLNVTFQFAGQFDGQAVAGKVVSIPAGTVALFGNFQQSIYGQQNDQGRLYFDAASTSITVGGIAG